jgi:hypothetical protein
VASFLAILLISSCRAGLLSPTDVPSKTIITNDYELNDLVNNKI